MRVTVSDLRIAANKLLAHLEEAGHPDITIDQDYYWLVSAQRRYDVEREITSADLTIGQLSDDWAELSAIIQGRKDSIGFGLTWLASLLRYVGETHVA